MPVIGGRSVPRGASGGGTPSTGSSTGWRYVALADPVVVLSASNPGATTEMLSPALGLPTSAVAISVRAMIRDRTGSAGASGAAAWYLYIINWDGHTAAEIHSSGVFDRGGAGSVSPVMVSQTGGGQFKYRVGSTSAICWLVVTGYWIDTAQEAS